MSNSVQPVSPAGARPEATRRRSTTAQIVRAVMALASATLLIRLIGMGNQIVVTSHYGAGATMDAYIVAIAMPTLLAQLVVSVMQVTVIPAFARARTHETNEQSSILFSTLLNLVLLGSALLTLLMFVFRRQIILISAPALDPLRLNMAVDLAPYVVPVFLLTVVLGFLECILNTEGQFGWPAYAGMLVPLSVASLVLLGGESLGVTALAVGTLVGLFLQLVLLVMRVRRARVSYRPVVDLRNPAIGAILVAGWPILLGQSMSESTTFADQMVASILSAGSISALSYALKLVGVPVGVIFMSVDRAMLPHLSRQAAAGDMRALKATLRMSVWVVGLGTAVLSVLMIVLAHPLVQILFQRGAFTAADTDRTAITLAGFAVGLVPMALGFIVPTAIVALGKTRPLMYLSLFSLAANAVFDLVLAHFWQSFGIALATSLVYTCSTCLKVLIVRRAIGKLDLLTPPRELLELVRKLRYRT